MTKKKNRSNFCEKPSSPFKTKNVTLIKKLKKKSQKIDFSISKKNTTQFSKNNSRQIFFTKCGYECILLKNIVENGLETQNFDQNSLLSISFSASIFFKQKSWMMISNHFMTLSSQTRNFFLSSAWRKLVRMNEFKSFASSAKYGWVMCCTSSYFFPFFSANLIY